MDGLGQGALNPAKTPPGSSGGGQGAFENFVASAIATILTIIFSWRLLLDTQDTPLAVEACPSSQTGEGLCSKKSSDGEGSSADRADDTGKVAAAGRDTTSPARQVDIEQKSVTLVTHQTSSASSQLLNESGLENNVTADKHEEKTSRPGRVYGRSKNNPFKPGSTTTRSKDGRVLIPLEVTADLDTCMEPRMDQYEQPGSLAGNHLNNKGAHYGHSIDLSAPPQPELLPRPSWAATEPEPASETKVLHHLLKVSSSVSDSSGDEDDTETEGDISSDSTLECREGDNDADQSDSDGSFGTYDSNHSGEAREFSLGDPLGDESSESEYCVVFNSMLEAITEEDTDAMSTSDLEKDSSRSDHSDKSDKEDHIDSIVIPLNSENSARAPLDDAKSELDNTLAKYSSQQDVSIEPLDINSSNKDTDTDGKTDQSSTSITYGPRVNTHRPLVIGPYRDIMSNFSKEQCIATGSSASTNQPVVNIDSDSSGLTPEEKSRYLDYTSVVFPPPPPPIAIDQLSSSEINNSGLEDSSLNDSDQGNIHDASFDSINPNITGPSNGDYSYKSSISPTFISKERVNLSQPVTPDISRSSSASPEASGSVYINRKVTQLNPDRTIKDHKSNLDHEQSINKTDSDQSNNIQQFNLVSSKSEEERPNSNAESDLDSLTECYHQFQNAALNQLAQQESSLSNTNDNRLLSDKDNSIADKRKSDEPARDSISVKERISKPATPQEKLDPSKITPEQKEYIHRLVGDISEPNAGQLIVMKPLNSTYFDNNVNSLDVKKSPVSDAPLSFSGITENPITFVQTANVEHNFVLRNTTVDKNQTGPMDNYGSLHNPDKSFPSASDNLLMSSSRPPPPYTHGLSLQSDKGDYNDTMYNRSPVDQYGLPPNSRHASSGDFYGIRPADQPAGLVNTRNPQFDSIISDNPLQNTNPYQPSSHGGHFPSGHYNNPDGPMVQSKDLQPVMNARDQSRGRPQDYMYHVNNNPTQQNPGLHFNEHSDPYSGFNHSNSQVNPYTPQGYPSSNNTFQNRPYSHNPNNGHYLGNQLPAGYQGLNDSWPDTPLVNDDIIQRDIQRLSGNIVAHRDINENRGLPYHALATSSAIKRRPGDPRDDSSILNGSFPPSIASAEATGENPYVAVARATARAATIASANAPPPSSTSPSKRNDDMSLMVSTSCLIKEDNNLPSEIPPPLPQKKQGAIQQLPSQLEAEQKKKMMITIEQHHDTKRKEYRTIECDVPKNIDGDVTAMISEAVKRIIASQTSLANQKGSKLNKTIEAITRQVVAAYSDTDTDTEDYPLPPPPAIGNANIPYYPKPYTKKVRHETIPEFRVQNTIPTSTTRQPVTNSGPRYDSRSPERPGAYLSRAINQPRYSPSSHIFGDDSEKPVFYVTGSNQTPSGHGVDDVVLKVVADKHMQPTVEHVIMPGSDSEKDSPLMRTKMQPEMHKIKEEGPDILGDILDDKPKKKSKPERPKLPGSLDINQEDKATPATSSNFLSPSSGVKSILKSPMSKMGSDTKDITQKSKNIPTSRDKNPFIKDPKVLKSPTAPKPYSSVLLTPIEDSKTPYHVQQQYDVPKNTNHEKAEENKKDFLDKEKKKSDIPVAIPNTNPTRIDIEFEKRKKNWRARSTSPRSSVVLVDIDIESGNDSKSKSRSKSVEDLKRRLERSRPRAPSNEHIEKQWEGVSEKISKSQERLHRSRNSSISSDISQHSFSSLKRSHSMGALPGQFFSDRRSYTSLIETDLDTGVSTAIPLIQETNIDEFSIKSKSMTNLHTAQTFRTYEIYDDGVKHKSNDDILSSDTAKKDSLMAPQNSIGDHRSKSAHELRISNSLNKLSLPDWYKAQSPQNKPVELVNTRKPPRIPYEVGTQGKRAGDFNVLPSKPIILNHRVSRSLSKSPTSSACTTPVEGQPVFELPSNKLRNKEEASLHRIPLKRPEPIPPLPPRRQPAKEAYLKLKAQSDPATWEPLSSLSPTRNSQLSEKSHQKTSYTSSVSYQSPRQQEHTSRSQSVKVTTHKQMMNSSEKSLSPIRPNSEKYVTEKYVRLSQSERDTLSDVNAQKTGSSDSGFASMEPQQRSSHNSTVYSPGRTVTTLVKDLKIETNHEDLPHDSGIDTASPDPAYARMLNTLENESREIQNKTGELTSSKAPPQMQNRQTNSVDRDRNSFPILSLSGSPGSNRRSFRSAETVSRAPKPEASKVTLTLADSGFKNQPQSRNRRGSVPLDEVLGGLLAIPPPPGHPDDPEPPVAPADAPMTRNVKVLKMANTPKGSDIGMNNEDPDDDMVIIECKNSRCGKSVKLNNARNSYKTCHNCFTYYCSRECRKDAWEEHKQHCLFSRINSGCKHIIKMAQSNDAVAEEISRVARTGYLTKGRGCVMLVFPNAGRADHFTMNGLNALDIRPNYASVKDIQESEVFEDHEKELVQMCKSYNPELKYVLEVAIVAGDKIPQWPIPRKEGPIIKKCAKVKLHTGTIPPKTNKKDEPETLILTAVPGSEFTENMEERTAREVCFINIQRKLRQRGVSLRHSYPDVYKKLCTYVEDNAHFTPISLYPVDVNTGKRFMCLIMPNSEPEADWMYKQDLLDDLDLHTNV